VKRALEYLGIEIAFLFVSIVYMICLHLFNQKLITFGLADNAFALIKYDNYKALWYFLGAVVLYMIGIFRIISHWKGLSCSYLGIEEMLMSWIAIIAIIFLLIGIFTLINNPILRAIIVISALIYSLVISQA